MFLFKIRALLNVMPVELCLFRKISTVHLIPLTLAFYTDVDTCDEILRLLLWVMNLLLSKFKKKIAQKDEYIFAP